MSRGQPTRVTKRFWELLHALPRDVQLLARKNYELWRDDPRHPSLRFRLLGGTSDLYSVRIGRDYRAIGQMEADGMRTSQIVRLFSP